MLRKNYANHNVVNLDYRHCANHKDALIWSHGFVANSGISLETNCFSLYQTWHLLNSSQFSKINPSFSIISSLYLMCRKTCWDLLLLFQVHDYVYKIIALGGAVNAFLYGELKANIEKEVENKINRKRNWKINIGFSGRNKMK